MYFVYLLPFTLLTGLLGTLGGLLAVAIFALGLLRALFLSVLLVTGDMKRFKEEQTEGLSVVIEKIKMLWQKMQNVFK